MKPREQQSLSASSAVSPTTAPEEGAGGTSFLCAEKTRMGSHILSTGKGTLVRPRLSTPHPAKWLNKHLSQERALEGIVANGVD